MFVDSLLPFADLSWSLVWEVFSLRLHNTRLVVLSTTVLGLASGLVGSFLLLRKRSLLSDALSHACLPGLGLAFILMFLAGGSGRFLPGLIAGAVLTGLLGSATVLWIRQNTRIKDDAAMGIVLSVFFGFGVVVLSVIQGIPGARAAGLESFLYGKASGMLVADFYLIIAVATVVLLTCALLRKEFLLLCFDETYAATQGWPVGKLDLSLLLLIAGMTVVGMQAVGLILIIAFLIIPAAAARFWTNDLGRMLLVASLVGGLSGWAGSSLSALLPRLPAGAVVVVVAATIFLFSLIFGSARGVFQQMIQYQRLKRKEGRQHLLRGVYEILESQCRDEKSISNHRVALQSLFSQRSWSHAQFQRLIRRARRDDLIDFLDDHSIGLSENGFGEAVRTTRNHRLWELYLINFADIAPSHVDRDADAIEHVLSPSLVRDLEEKLGLRAIPPSPHALVRREVD